MPCSNSAGLKKKWLPLEINEGILDKKNVEMNSLLRYVYTDRVIIE